MVAGRRIQEHALKHGEEIEVGNTRLKLFTSAMADAQTLVEAEKSAFRPAIRTDEGVLTGQAISHYELGPVLARGSTGTVYKARDIRDGKDVALKVLYREIAHDEASLRRFMQVMKTVVGMHHPNLVALCGAGKHGETCWFAMEYVEGEPLTKVIERLGTRKMINWRYALSMGMQIARALEALHEKHIVHRNVAPENILIRSKDKVPKLGDMMLARVVDGAEARPSPPGRAGGQRGLHGPRADPRRCGGRHPRRHLQPGGDPLYPPDRQAAVRGQDAGRRPSPRSGRTTRSRPSGSRTRSPTSSRTS